MCYDDNARAPIPPGANGGAQGEDIVLTAADSNRFAAYLARPATPNGAQVLIYPDVRGLHQFYKDLALRFAEVGITALAIDYFGRTAGLTARDDSFEFWPHVQQMQLSSFFEDVRAATAYLHTQNKQPIFTIGFCMGGSLVLYSGTQNLDLTGLIAFYAGMSRKFGGAAGTVLEEAKNIHYPVLGLFGGADQGIPPEQVRELDEVLDTTRVDHEIVIYEGAPHSFFDRRYADFASESADAWERILAFIEEYTPQ